MLNVVEIFDSFQGEGCNMGLPVTFIRLAGCNKECYFCDEKWRAGVAMREEDIVAKCTLPSVVITGGEPTLQDCSKLVGLLLDKEKDIFVETNGLNNPRWLAAVDWIAVSPKDGDRIHPLLYVDEIKLIVTHTTTLEDVRKYDTDTAQIWLQPCDEEGYDNRQKVLELAKETGYRVGMQLHKYYGVK